jgi:hypothetical protein
MGPALCENHSNQDQSNDPLGIADGLIVRAVPWLAATGWLTEFHHSNLWHYICRFRRCRMLAGYVDLARRNGGKRRSYQISERLRDPIFNPAVQMGGNSAA